VNIILDSGKRDKRREKAEELWLKMGHFMKGFGKITRNMDLEGSSTLKETCIKANG